MKKAKKVYDENGKLQRVLHAKCYYVEKREATALAQVWYEAPTAYEAAQAHRNADDVDS